MNETARQCRVKAEAYFEHAEDAYLYPLLMSAADTIELLEEKVKIMASDAGVRACGVENLASLRLRVNEMTRRLARLEAQGDQLLAEFRDDPDFPPK